VRVKYAFVVTFEARSEGESVEEVADQLFDVVHSTDWLGTQVSDVAVEAVDS
jgi:hypothetical protein